MLIGLGFEPICLLDKRYIFNLKITNYFSSRPQVIYNAFSREVFSYVPSLDMAFDSVIIVRLDLNDVIVS